MHLRSLRVGFCAAAAMFALADGHSRASDHADTPMLITLQRHDARITDLYALMRDDNLVLAVCLDPTVPPAATSYHFASDLTIQILVDTKPQVRFDDPDDLATYGGTILRPEVVSPDVVFEITFDEAGEAQLAATGLSRREGWPIELFAGLRDDPFIRGPRTGRNVAALVVELPVRAVVPGAVRPMLVWATSRVDDVMGPFHEHGGRALRSQFIENDPLNMRTPAEHASVLYVVPDVIILDPTLPTAYPNGREFADDVVDLVGDPRILSNDDPFPDTNDMPFLTEFPYLAPPHPAP